MEKRKRVRLDDLLVKLGFADNPERAEIIIRMGRVRAESRILDKPGILLSESIILTVDEGKKFVSRGGDKLEGALSDLNLDVKGLVCMDLGSSTGGFTDCLLKSGALRVYAVDVGKNLLHEKLQEDSRVTFLQKNARYLSPDDFSERVDLVTVDLSFISIAKIVPVIGPLLKPEGRALVMVKPQFELDRKKVVKGVVKDQALIREAVEKIRTEFLNEGYREMGQAASKIRGPKGNHEQFLLMRSGH